MMAKPLAEHRLLVANRGEIAVRIIRTARALGITCLSIYTPSDSLSPHVTFADQAFPLPASASESDSGSETKAYLSIPSIIQICRENGVTMLHPGYGFLAESHQFAESVIEMGVIWLGPRPEIIKTMGLKHEARKLAEQVGIEVIPGSAGLVKTVNDARKIADELGYPIMVKATAGGGGMGMVICEDEKQLVEGFDTTMARSQMLFDNGGLLLERYISSARHIEVQVFGNGEGDVIHMGERECSIQRRNQKLIEETPSPFLLGKPDLRKDICLAAVRLCQLLKYDSAGTVELLVDDRTGKFYFLEMNTRIQVEHTITEEVHPGLDIVALMIRQGVSSSVGEPFSLEIIRSYEAPPTVHAIECRFYCENPVDNFRPSPGVLQYVHLSPEKTPWFRVETWVSTGTIITSNFDSLLAKIIVSGSNREEAKCRMLNALDACKVYGPPNNISYLKAVVGSELFSKGLTTTRALESFEYHLHAVTITSPGLESTIQDLEGRTTGYGIPRSGAMDDIALAFANHVVGNEKNAEAIELVLGPGLPFVLKFHARAVFSVSGKDCEITVVGTGTTYPPWRALVVEAGNSIAIRVRHGTPGFRNYIAIRNGFPEIAEYLGSKSTSMGLGGYQGRSLRKGDQLTIGHQDPILVDELEELSSSIRPMIPIYPQDHWIIHVLSGPHDDVTYLTSEGTTGFYATRWRVGASSNRMGIRLESKDRKIGWARTTGGQGGSHPSNILDNGYSFGSINVNGDTPVILTNEGPDMGGYVCLCTVVTGDRWKLGQLSPGCTIEFRRVDWSTAMIINERASRVLNWERTGIDDGWSVPYQDMHASDSPVLYQADVEDDRCAVLFRQAGDSAILVEFGDMVLDLSIRMRIHLFENALLQQKPGGLIRTCPCIRSIMCHFNHNVTDQSSFLSLLILTERGIPNSVEDITVEGTRRFTFPIVLDDKWNKEALERYMRTTRDKAVYLPSNVDYLASNNGLEDKVEALRRLVGTDWLTMGVGFYLACPFLVPIDPRCRLVGQKMNPSRTYTPRGAIGIAGVVAAIYPVESPGGYQLYGRTLPAWHTWGTGKDFSADKPWLLMPFDQIRFEAVDEEKYEEIEREFDAGRYSFKTEAIRFSLRDHKRFIQSIEEELKNFLSSQSEGIEKDEAREMMLLRDWEEGKARTELATERDHCISDDSEENGTIHIQAPVSGSVFKIHCLPGQVIERSDELIMVLEAMKTEIKIDAEETAVGKTVKTVCVSEGDVVKDGQTVVVLSS